MSLEVSGQPEGVTLIQAIEAENIPLPEPMSFPKWQHWRQHEGRRLSKKKDGIARSTADEVKLWKEVMEFFHDIKSDDEDEEEEEEEEKHKDASLERAPDAGGGRPSLAARADDRIRSAGCRSSEGSSGVGGQEGPGTRGP